MIHILLASVPEVLSLKSFRGEKEQLLCIKANRLQTAAGIKIDGKTADIQALSGSVVEEHCLLTFFYVGQTSFVCLDVCWVSLSVCHQSD